MEKTLFVNKVLEVVIVKGSWSLKIKRCQIIVPWPWCLWTTWLPCGCKWSIYVGLIIDSCSKICAPCLSNCVSSCSIN
jgi:hypothetical protein